MRGAVPGVGPVRLHSSSSSGGTGVRVVDSAGSTRDQRSASRTTQQHSAGRAMFSVPTTVAAVTTAASHSVPSPSTLPSTATSSTRKRCVLPVVPRVQPFRCPP